MKKLIGLLLTFCSCSVMAQQVNKVSDPSDWVNPLMGSDSKPDLSNGNTYPAVGTPWGMNYWSAQTGKMGDGWMYTYASDKIRGFKQTHQPSPWMNDYGQFAIMPVTGHMKFEQDARASWFSHKSEISKPYYYSVYLADHDVMAEMTTTERAAQFQFSYPKSDSSFIVVDALDRGSYIKIFPKENKIIGYTTKNARSKPVNFKNYFVIYTDKPFTIARAWHGKTLAGADSLELSANHTGAIIGFKTSKGEKVHLRVASSLISFEQAELNLQREVG